MNPNKTDAAGGASLSDVGLGVVYGDNENWFFSDGVKRAFGENKTIKLLNGNTVFCSVMPLKCDPLVCGLRIVGTIHRDA